VKSTHQKIHHQNDAEQSFATLQTKHTPSIDRNSLALFG